MSTESFVPIIGRKDAGIFPRLAIEDLQSQQPYQFTLFILSYLVIQGRDIAPPDGAIVQSDIVQAVYSAVNQLSASSDLSALQFDQLASIHGLPYEAWKGDQKGSADAKAHYDGQDPKDSGPSPSRFGGYCNHGSVLFPSWHRPYVMAIEQAIGNVAEQVAEQFEKTGRFEKNVWRDAAQALRFPFWDWAEERVVKEGLPPVLSDDEVTLSVGSEKVKVPNPLSYFKFKSIPTGFVNITDDTTGVTAYFAEWPRTVRYAPSNPNIWGSDTDALNKSLKKEAPSLRSRVALLFTLSDSTDTSKETARTYDEFSNHTVQSTNKLHYYTADSLEGIHDSVHNVVGGNGHMANPDYAGFDPIFFLHHCNVDRLYALWEYVYPKDIYIGNGTDYTFTQNTGTYALVYNQELLGQTELAPFRLPDGNYWTSDHSRYFDAEAYPKYYTYPEIVGIKVDQPATDEEREKYRHDLQKYYGLEDTLTKEGLANVPDHIVIGVQTPEFAFNGPYSVQVHYKAFNTEDIYVGSISVFARQHKTNCAACRRRRAGDSSIHGLIPVPSSIIEDVIEGAGLDVASLGVDKAVGEIMEKLKKHLTAVIVDSNGKELGSAKGSTRQVAAHEALDTNFTPIITLASSSIQEAPRDGTNHPVKWANWVSHGEIFQPGLEDRGWKAGSGAVVA